MYVLVGLDEVGAQYRCKELWGSDWVLLGYYVGCLLHGVCRNNNAIVCFGVAVEGVKSTGRSLPASMLNLRSINLAFEHHAYRHLHNSVSLGSLIFVHLVHTDVILSITGCLNFRHIFEKGRKLDGLRSFLTVGSTGLCRGL